MKQVVNEVYDLQNHIWGELIFFIDTSLDVLSLKFLKTNAREMKSAKYLHSDCAISFQNLLLHITNVHGNEGLIKS